MSIPPDLAPRDPEFDRPPRPQSTPNVEVVRFYQRLVVNPFLGLSAGCLTLGFTVALFRVDVDRRVRVLSVLLGFVAAYFLLQYHCLDCGKTGLFHRWNGHTCPSIIQRWETTNPARLRFPAAPTQMVLWFIAMGLAGIVFLWCYSGT